MPDTTRAQELESSLEQVARLSLRFGRLLMEAGARSRKVESICGQVAHGLGADHIDVRVGYASLALTIGRGSVEITRIGKVGALGVNQRLYHALCALASRIERGELTSDGACKELDAVSQNSKRHPDWLVALAVGIACAAFGRLLRVDSVSLLPIFLAGTIGQWIRRQLAARHVNVFLAAAIVTFTASILSGLGSVWAGSRTLAMAMVVPVVLLVPGVPSFNAQLDILEGRPTLGSARAVWVAALLVFMALGVWLALGLFGERAQ